MNAQDQCNARHRPQQRPIRTIFERKKKKFSNNNKKQRGRFSSVCTKMKWAPLFKIETAAVTVTASRLRKKKKGGEGGGGGTEKKIKIKNQRHQDSQFYRMYAKSFLVSTASSLHFNIYRLCRIQLIPVNRLQVITRSRCALEAGDGGGRRRESLRCHCTDST